MNNVAVALYVFALPFLGVLLSCSSVQAPIQAAVSAGLLQTKVIFGNAKSHHDDKGKMVVFSPLSNARPSAMVHSFSPQLLLIKRCLTIFPDNFFRKFC